MVELKVRICMFSAKGSTSTFNKLFIESTFCLIQNFIFDF